MNSLRIIHIKKRTFYPRYRLNDFYSLRRADLPIPIQMLLFGLGGLPAFEMSDRSLRLGSNDLDSGEGLPPLFI